MFLEERRIPLPEEEFRLLSDLIRQYCGIYFDQSSKYILERRLSKRLELRHLDNFRDYYRFLLYDRKKDEELSAIMDNLTVNETYFFREKNQLDAFCEIAEEIRHSRGNSRKSLRIWSAGCSSGEEPYTVAMLLIEKNFSDWELEIVGSDINQRVLQSARKGVYRKNSFRTTEDYYIQRYFDQEEAGSYRVKDAVKKYVSFSFFNLLDSLKTRLVGTVDIIFCRNVLIYFDAEARKKVVENFYERLSEGGYLLLGHAESLMNISTSFSLKHLKKDIVYRKPAGQQGHTDQAATALSVQQWRHGDGPDVVREQIR
jgi:chemotaxis protein methyltransferase CheR